MATQTTPKEVIYPESDGKPMAETDLHRDEMLNLISALAEHYREDPQVYVSGNLFVYYVEGDTRKKVSPDVLVVRGVRKGRRRTYKIWEEGKAPEVVIEVSSGETHYEDLYAKRELYEELGVKEYYLYDPTGDYLPNHFLAYRRQRGQYREVKPKRGAWKSEVLGLLLKVEANRLRFYDTVTGARLLTPEEQAAARREAEAARREAEAARREAEAARREAEAARQKAETERNAAEKAQEQEAQARRAAEAALERLRAELDRLKKKT
jgi:Uma2 family endonuclease